ncbi:MAG: hypothetical protein IPK15_24015 [Verrucomicrobia bacterium]|nr:hypothetical protein [Verrucomicrobiota bacterium]
MNKTIVAWAAFTAIPFGVNAQWAVFDAAVQTQLITGTAQEIAKYVEMINNQVTQIRTLTDQLNEFRHYESLFGDPKAVVVTAAGPLRNDLRRTELGESLQVVIRAADGAEALAYNAAGLYHSVGATFDTPKGHTVARHTNEFRPFAAINGATANFQLVSTNAAARRVELKRQIAATVEALRTATTDAEVQKLSGTLTGLSAALNGTEQETAQALATALVQDIENRNDEKKQALALREQQGAAFTEAVTNYARTFRLLDAPTTFPR